jgi:hypothetical protein
MKEITALNIILDIVSLLIGCFICACACMSLTITLEGKMYKRLIAQLGSFEGYMLSAVIQAGMILVWLIGLALAMPPHVYKF